MSSASPSPRRLMRPDELSTFVELPSPVGTQSPLSPSFVPASPSIHPMSPSLRALSPRRSLSSSRVPVIDSPSENPPSVPSMSPPMRPMRSPIRSRSSSRCKNARSRSPVAWKCVGTATNLRRVKRLHVEIEGRYISVILHNDEVFCIDSICFHAGGPLASGDIEDIPIQDDGSQTIPCVTCPWHQHKISLIDGSKFVRKIEFSDGTPKPEDHFQQCLGKYQRTHECKVEHDKVLVSLNLDGKFSSDEYAHHEKAFRNVVSHLTQNVSND